MTQNPYDQGGQPMDSGNVFVTRTSKLATASLVLGILSLPLGCTFVLPVIGLVLGILALVKIGKAPTLWSGKGLAISGIVTSGVGLVMIAPLALLIAILLPSLGKAREMAKRSVCAANLRMIAQSMQIYASENSDAYPVLPYAPYGPANAGSANISSPGSTPDAIHSMYGPTSPVKGSPLAGVWLMVMSGSVSPRQMLCPSDTSTSSPASPTTPTGDHFVNFQSDGQISYSFAYPYEADKERVGAWWRNETDAFLPVAADMAPLNGTGKPPRDVTVAGSWNSGNHQNDGQNVAFGDGHVEFSRIPSCGQDSDNIFTAGPGGGSERGGRQPAAAPIQIRASDGPGTPGGSPGNWDTVMVPARNLTTGSLW